jgi:hypothetical protein
VGKEDDLENVMTKCVTLPLFLIGETVKANEDDESSSAEFLSLERKVRIAGLESVLVIEELSKIFLICLPNKLSESITVN